MDIRIGAYGVIVEGGRVLLSHWNEGGRQGWTMPGGGVEDDEHPVETARREIREETGYEVEIGRLLGIDTFVIPAHERIAPSDRPVYAMRIVYRAQVVGGELTHERDGSTDEARWVELTEVPGLDRVELVDIALRLDAETPLDGRLTRR